MSKLCEIPAEKFPLRYEKYVLLCEEIRDAARGFEALGTPAGRRLDRELMKVYSALGVAWEKLRDFERAGK